MPNQFRGHGDLLDSLASLSFLPLLVLGSVPLDPLVKEGPPISLQECTHTLLAFQYIGLGITSYSAA